MDLKQIKDEALSNHVPIFKDDGINTLISIIKDNKVETILEFGTAVGYSSLAMASIDNNINIDTYEINIDSYNKAIENIKELNKEKQINVYLQDGLLAKLKDNYYDLIFVDAAKSKYKQYMAHSLYSLKSDGIYVFDNLMFHNMVDNPSLTHNRNTKALVRKIKLFRQWLLSNPYLDVTYLPNVADGIAIVKIKDKNNVMSWEVQ